jgi:hypothetical protein
MTRETSDAKLLIALAEGRNLTTAAAQAGVSLATAKRRWAEPAFRAKVAAAQDEIIDSALRSLAASAEAASLTIRSLLGKGTADTVRLAASRTILDHIRDRDLDARLAKIEETLFPAPTALPPSITTMSEKRG